MRKCPQLADRQEQPPVSIVSGKERLERTEQAMAVPKLVKVEESCMV